MRISARNKLKGTVKSIRLGAVNAEITVELPGRVEIVSIITKHSVEQLQLSAGNTVYAVINVMFGADH
jgi:molybdate transport system regulatory protein